MEKVRKYGFEKIEICRNCGGAGYVIPKVEGNFLLRRMQNPERRITCDVCEGSGRVEKHTEITVTVRSLQ